MDRPTLHRLRTSLCRCTNAQTLLVLILLFCLRARRRLRHLRPRDLVMPALTAQLLVLILAVTLTPARPLPIAAAGNLLIVALAILPSTRAARLVK